MGDTVEIPNQSAHMQRNKTLLLENDASSLLLGCPNLSRNVGIASRFDALQLDFDTRQVLSGGL